MARLMMSRTGLVRLLATLVFVLLVAFAQVASAQDQNKSAADPAWDATATSAEIALEEMTTHNATLESLRATLVSQREAAQELSDEARPRIEILQRQLDALGVAVENEAEASPETARRRAALTEQLEQARVPVLDGDLAFERADTLVKRIDEKLRERLTERLTALGPSPVNPGLWPAALQNLRSYGLRIGSGYTNLTGNGTQRSFLGQIPFAIFLGILALVIPFAALPRAIRASVSNVTPDSSAKSAYRTQFFVALLRLCAAALSAFFATLAFRQLDPGHLPRPLIETGIPGAFAATAVGYFVSRTLFGDAYGVVSVGNFTQTQAARARRLTFSLGGVLAIAYLLAAITTSLGFSDGSRAVVFFPLFVLGALLLWPLGRILTDQQTEAPEGSAGGTSLRVMRWFARLATFVAIAVPVVGAIGYFNLASFLFTPTLLTYFVLACLLIVFVFLRDFLEVWMLGDTVEETYSAPVLFRLLPVFIAIMLFMVGAPILALIWGARVTDLQEIWFWLSDGIPIGEARLSIPDIFTSIIIFVVGYGLTRALQGTVRNSVLPRTDLDLGAKNAIVTGLGYIGIFIAALMAITATGLNLSNLAIVAGALSVGIGFGLQTIVSNFVSGIILLIERPIKEGDWIEVAGHAGYVRRISVRSTSINTFDKASVIVPNAELIAGTVLNRTHQSLQGRVIVPIGVAYGTDPRQVEKLLNEIGKAHPMVVSNPPVNVVFVGFGADSLDFEIRAHIRDVNYSVTVKSDMNYEIVDKFAEAGIEIPFSQRDVAIKDADRFIDAFKGQGS